jgi:hypothetical protein
MKIDEIYTLPARDENPESFHWHFDPIDYEETLRTGLKFIVTHKNNETHIGVRDQNLLISYVGLHKTDGDLWQVDMQCTSIEYRNQGYIRRSIEYAIQKYGCILSDQGQTLYAQRTWTALVKNPNLFHYYFYNMNSKEQIPLFCINGKLEPNPFNQPPDTVILACNRTLSEQELILIKNRELWEIKMGRRDRWLGPGFLEPNP